MESDREYVQHFRMTVEKAIVDDVTTQIQMSKILCKNEKIRITNGEK